MYRMYIFFRLGRIYYGYLGCFQFVCVSPWLRHAVLVCQFGPNLANPGYSENSESHRRPKQKQMFRPRMGISEENILGCSVVVGEKLGVFP